MRIILPKEKICEEYLNINPRALGTFRLSARDSIISLRYGLEISRSFNVEYSLVAATFSKILESFASDFDEEAISSEENSIGV